MNKSIARKKQAQPDSIIRIKNREAIIYFHLTETASEKFEIKLQLNIKPEEESAKETLDWMHREFSSLKI